MKITANYPPVWLAGFMGVAWAISEFYAPWSESTLSVWAGRILIAAGLLVMLWAAVQFRQARTTIVPHEAPSALVSGGPFRFSRNPIYTADLVILTGWCLTLGAPTALPLVLPLLIVLERFFIRPEEGLLKQGLGDAYTDYMARVRRWL